MKPSRSLLRDQASHTFESYPCSVPVETEWPLRMITGCSELYFISVIPRNRENRRMTGFSIVRACVLAHQLQLGKACIIRWDTCIQLVGGLGPCANTTNNRNIRMAEQAVIGIRTYHRQLIQKLFALDCRGGGTRIHQTPG